MITLEQVLKAYDYAESHPHKYLRGTTNWCAAVAWHLNKNTGLSELLSETMEELQGAWEGSWDSIPQDSCYHKIEALLNKA